MKAEDEVKIFMQYNNIVYVPGQALPKTDFTEKDPVLDKAVEVLKEGPEKIIAQKADMSKASQEQAEQEAGADAQKKSAPAQDK